MESLRPEHPLSSRPQGRSSPRPFLLSGCSGGGKSTLLAELARRGFSTFEEAGRQIVREQLAAGEGSLPWEDVERFVELLWARACRQYADAAEREGPVFLDRGVIEPFAWYRRTGRAMPSDVERAARDLRYAYPVFLAPPWPEIFEGDGERRHGLDEAIAEYGALTEACAMLGYRTVELPKMSVAARADFVLAETRMGLSPSGTP